MKSSEEGFNSESTVESVLPNNISLIENLLINASQTLTRSFFAPWPLTAILRLRKVNNLMRHVADNYLEEGWDSTEFFSSWFTDPIAFRQLLRKCNGVVTGSQSLNFLNRHTCLYSPLDIVVPAETFSIMGRWLIIQGGYELDVTVPVDFRSSFRSINTSAKVTLTVSYGHVLARILGSYHSMSIYVLCQFSKFSHKRPFIKAASMNFISWNKAVCLFPHSTLIQLRAYTNVSMYGPNGVTRTWVEKFQSRGYEIIGSSFACKMRPKERYKRRIFDSLSWIINLNCHGKIACFFLSIYF